MVISSAPGKIILFGEHAVVYDKLGIVCSVDKRCRVKSSPFPGREIGITSHNLGIKGSLDEKGLFRTAEEVRAWEESGNFQKIKERLAQDNLAPSFFVVAEIFKKYQTFQGMRIEISSDIPNSLGSSSAVFSALSLGVLKLLGKNPSKDEISGFSYRGDIMAHGGTPSGIDNSAVTWGGYLAYRKSDGIRKMDIDFNLPLLVVDSGRKARTSETVSYIRGLREKNPSLIDGVMERLNSISERSLEALSAGSLGRVGSLMTEYYRELKKLHISTPELDGIIGLALKNGALGGKPTGGWGGGCCLVLAEDESKGKRLSDIFQENGFSSFPVVTEQEGVKLITP